jgi:hypothetical protein
MTVEPVDSFREAAVLLRRPFTPAAVKFKVQSTAGDRAMIVSYIDARLVVERLNLIVPHLWHDEYAAIDQRTMLCRLTVDGITRQDVGEGQGKGLYSDALKRAAVKFGIGVSLYSIPRQWLAVTDRGTDTTLKKGRNGPILTDANEAHLRGLYARWLDSHGKGAFGEPLDHGDQDGSQGDTEADDDAAVQPAETDGLPNLNPDPPMPEEGFDTLRELKAQAEVSDTEVRVFLASLGVANTRSLGQAIKGLTTGQYLLVKEWLEQAGNGVRA